MIPAQLPKPQETPLLPKPLNSHQQRDIKEAEAILLSIKLLLERRSK